MEIRNFAFLLALLALSGCSSAPSGTGLFSWWTTRGERAERRAETALASAREAQLLAARLEAAKTAFAASVLPPSPEATLTARFAGNTDELMAQAVPGATAEQLAAVRRLVADLRSTDARIVAAAEQRQQASERDAAALSRQLAESHAALVRAETRSGEIAADNAQLAGQLLAMRWAAAAASVLSVAATLAALAYRTNALGLATGVAKGLASLRINSPDAAALATTALDVGLDRAEQTTLSRLVHQHLHR